MLQWPSPKEGSYHQEPSTPGGRSYLQDLPTLEEDGGRRQLEYGVEDEELDHPISPTARTAEQLSVTFRRIGHALATLNAIWLVVSCLFQLVKFYDQCYCDSSYLGLRSKAYAVFNPIDYDIAIMKKAWYWGVGLGASCSFAFFAFIWVYINPPLPEA